jgi:hypothetical protein
MPTLLIIEKTGSIKELNVKNYAEEELYKKAGFKTSEGFKLITSWDVKIDETKYFISVYGKTTGRAGQENKYEFPPPIDTTLFFGNCVLVNQLECEPVSNLKKSDWDKIYDHLYGGFEDLDDDDSELSKDNDSEEHLPRTKTGYVKDDFIVEDDASEESEESDEQEEETDEEPVIEKKKKPLKKESIKNEKPLKKKDKKATVFEKIDTSAVTPETSSIFLDCSSELEEEEYV